MKFYDLEISLCDDGEIILEQGFDPHTDKDRIVITKEQALVVAHEFLRLAEVKQEAITENKD